MTRDEFRRRRERLGMTQEELAKRLGKSRPSIARYEAVNGTPIPKAVAMALELIENQERRKQG